MHIGHIKIKVMRVLNAIFGQNYVKKRLLSRNLAFYQECGIVFVHVPKNAGSSVSRALYGRSLGHRTAAEMVGHTPTLFQDIDSLAILRDPIDRAISAWKYCKFGGTSQGAVAHRAEYDLEEFSTFERFATEWLPKQNPESVDFVLQPQSRFVCDDKGEILVANLVMLENLAQQWPEIIDKLNCKSLELPVRNKMKQEDEKTIVSPASIHALKEFYKNDFDLIDRHYVINGSKA
jgi:hypothetical protein